MNYLTFAYRSNTHVYKTYIVSSAIFACSFFVAVIVNSRSLSLSRIFAKALTDWITKLFFSPSKERNGLRTKNADRMGSFHIFRKYIWKDTKTSLHKIQTRSMKLSPFHKYYTGQSNFIASNTSPCEGYKNFNLSNSPPFCVFQMHTFW